MRGKVRQVDMRSALVIGALAAALMGCKAHRQPDSPPQAQPTAVQQIGSPQAAQEPSALPVATAAPPLDALVNALLTPGDLGPKWYVALPASVQRRR